MHRFEQEKPLTIRELEVLNCIHQGLTNPEISQKLCITISTVKAHISSLLQKIDAKNRIELLLMVVGEKDIKNKYIKKQVMSLK